MPWSVKKQGNKYCVIKDTDGSTVACHPTKAKAEAQRKALYANVKEEYEAVESLMLEEKDGSVGPVIVGVAVTNVPALPLPPISIVEKNGQEMVRVPFLKQGVFRDSRYGRMVFSDKIFDKMLENHANGISHYGVALNERHTRGKALAWFTSDRGGFIEKETDDVHGKLLVAYGVLTSKENKELIESGQYRFASAEINPHYRPTMVKQFSLSMDDVEEIDEEDLLNKFEEVNTMDEITITQEEYDGLKEAAEKVEAAEAKVVELEEAAAKATKDAEKEAKKVNKKIADLEAKVVELEEQADDEDEDAPVPDDLPEEIKVMLEEQQAEIKRLKHIALEADVDKVIQKAEAYCDDAGRGHSPVLLNAARQILLGQDVAVGEDEVIKLESEAAVDVAKYTRNVVTYLLENLPGQVQFEAGEDEEVPNPTPNSNDPTEEDGKTLWDQTV